MKEVVIAVASFSAGLIAESLFGGKIVTALKTTEENVIAAIKAEIAKIKL